MATIISRRKITDRKQKNGWRYIRYEYGVEDNKGEISRHIVGPKKVSPEFDDEVDIISQGDLVLADLAEAEISRITRIHGVSDPLSTALAPQYAEPFQVFSAMFKWVMTESDPRAIVYLADVWEYIRSVYTDEQIASEIALTDEQLSRFLTRVTAILEPTSNAISVADQLLIFDANEEIA